MGETEGGEGNRLGGCKFKTIRYLGRATYGGGSLRGNRVTPPHVFFDWVATGGYWAIMVQKIRLGDLKYAVRIQVSILR